MRCTALTARRYANRTTTPPTRRARPWVTTHRMISLRSIGIPWWRPTVHHRRWSKATRWAIVDDLASRPDQEHPARSQPNTAEREVDLVGARGFEPPTSSSRTMRATRLRHAPTEGARCTEPADDSKGPAARPEPPAEPPQEPDQFGRQPDRVVADVLRATVLGRAVVDAQGALLCLRDVVLQRDVERAAAARRRRWPSPAGRPGPCRTPSSKAIRNVASKTSALPVTRRDCRPRPRRRAGPRRSTAAGPRSPFAAADRRARCPRGPKS